MAKLDELRSAPGVESDLTGEGLEKLSLIINYELKCSSVAVSEGRELGRLSRASVAMGIMRPPPAPRAGRRQDPPLTGRSAGGAFSLSGPWRGLPPLQSNTALQPEAAHVLTLIGKGGTIFVNLR